MRVRFDECYGDMTITHGGIYWGQHAECALVARVKLRGVPVTVAECDCPCHKILYENA